MPKVRKPIARPPPTFIWASRCCWQLAWPQGAAAAIVAFVVVDLVGGGAPGMAGKRINLRWCDGGSLMLSVNGVSTMMCRLRRAGTTGHPGRESTSW